MSLPLVNSVSEVSTDTDLVEDSCDEGRALGATSIKAVESTLLSEAIVDFSQISIAVLDTISCTVDEKSTFTSQFPFRTGENVDQLLL